MELQMASGPMLAVCPNPAWQKTLIFQKLQPGAVNRACCVSECGGGKGINVARVLRNLGFPVAVAGFIGGDPGRHLYEELQQSGAGDFTVACQNPTRCCYTIVDNATAQATELIEPSGLIAPAEVAAQLNLLRAHISEFSAVCLSGTLPPGVAPKFYAQIAALARSAGIPVLLDAYRDIAQTLAEGICMLKINAGELRTLSGKKELRCGAEQILSSFPLSWLAVTDGAATAWLFNRQESWRFTIPLLAKVVSPIGAGDCAAAILLRRLTEKPAAEKMPAFFAEALACASASCLTAFPSVFHPEEAEKIRSEILIS